MYESACWLVGKRMKWLILWRNQVVFKLRLKYNSDYWLDTAKSKSNANMRKVNMMVQRLVVVLLMMLFLVGCGEDTWTLSRWHRPVDEHPI